MAKGERFYRPELDVLRFIAFLLVFTSHEVGSAVGIGGIGASGLPIFFLLSAFLITELLLREREQTGVIHLSAFYKRRALRIWPLYFVFIIASAIWSRYGHSAIPGFERHSFPQAAFWSFALLAGNWYIYLQGGWVLAPVAPLWSISIEEQFYLVWPGIARSGGKKGIWIAAVVFYMASTATLVYLCHYGRTRTQIWTNSVVQFRYFALGAVLALWFHRRPVETKWWARCLLLIGSAAAMLISVNCLHLNFDNQSFSSQGAAYTLLDFGALTLFVGFYGLEIPGPLQPLVYLGKISYGLYVFHYFSLLVLGPLHLQHRYLPALGLTCVLAVISYYCIEQPFLKLKRHFVYVRNRED